MKPHARGPVTARPRNPMPTITRPRARRQTDWAEGMGSSVRCGIAALESLAGSAAEAAVLMLCDQPFVTASVIERLVAAYRTGRPLIIASEYVSQGKMVRGVPALFRRDLFEELSGLGAAEGAKSIIKRHESEAAIVAAQEGGFDVDTPEDYNRLRNEESDSARIKGR